MNFIEGCAECRLISGKYEAATLEWFRVQSQLGVAEFLRDNEASSRIVAELTSIGKRRDALRESASEHFNDQHAMLTAGRSG
jgi:hypothetical protein